MILREISLRNFRNYLKLNLRFDNRLNIIIGSNGVGKSNLLESIYILGFGRSPWATLNRDVINFNENWSTITGHAKDRNIEVKVKFLSNGHKKAEVNNKTVKSLSELLGLFTETLIGHEEINLVRGAPSYRRKLMDMHISQIDPEYVQCLNKYNKAVTARNKILEKLKGDGVVGGKVLLESWNDILVQNGAYIIRKRKAFLDKVEKQCKEFFSFLSNEPEKLDIEYSPSFEYSSVEAIEEDYHKKLNEKYSRELRYSNTFYGPHRDDLTITLDSRSMRRFGSWGQSRAASISILLASAQLLEDFYNCKPILLLDDCFTDLDEIRSRRLFELAPQIGQTFISSPKPLSFTQNTDGFTYKIHPSGVVERMQ
ncbi:DNA replication and repair protein RecF [bacterium]|nr:DNA replication and repair protein RecF [bacterium]